MGLVYPPAVVDEAHFKLTASCWHTVTGVHYRTKVLMRTVLHCWILI